jgi:tRNA(adenine34) deaminase
MAYVYFVTGWRGRRGGSRWRTAHYPQGTLRVVIIGVVPKKLRFNGSEEPGPGSNRDLRFMRRALEEAQRAAEKGEVPVGAVVVRGEEILAYAHNERETTQDPTAHAELLALRRAAARAGSWRLTGCTLYTTLEPCLMCAGALHAARISRLVYAAPDPKAGAAGTLYELPADTRLNHTYPYTDGILQSEATVLLQTFFKQRRRQ